MTQISEQVKLSLKESQESLREALSFSAKTEDSKINLAISQLILSIDNIFEYYETSKNSYDDKIRRYYGY